MEAVLDDWKKLSLTDVEGAKVSLRKSRNRNVKEYVLAAKFLTKRALNVEVIGRTFKPLWRARNDFKIRQANDHILLFAFEFENDAERVLATEPWVFDKHLVLFQRYDFTIPTEQLRFTTTKFWVQIHGLPLNMLDAKTAVEIGETIGPVSKTEHEKDMVGGTFLRVKAEVDVTKPLCRGRKIALNDDDETWVSFKYEKLPNFCYWCGMVSHGDRECDVWLSSKGSLSLDQQGYGNWMRASPFNPKKTLVTTVTGVGDGFGPKASRIQSQSDEAPATDHVGNVNANSEEVINTGYTTGGEELQKSTRPELNAVNVESISIKKPPTDHYMQLSGEDSDINSMHVEHNVSENITQSLKSPIHAELNGVIIGDASQSFPSQTELKDNNTGLINANHDQAFSDTNVPRRWKRVERMPHARNCCPNPQENTQNKRYRDEEDMDQPELPSKKLQVSMAESQQITMVEAARQPHQEQ